MQHVPFVAVGLSFSKFLVMQKFAEKKKKHLQDWARTWGATNIVWCARSERRKKQHKSSSSVIAPPSAGGHTTSRNRYSEKRLEANPRAL